MLHLVSRVAIDWDYFRHKYVSGDDSVTLSVLSRLPNAPNLTTLKRRSREELWAEQRRQFRYQAATKMADSATTQEALRQTEQLVDQVEAIARHLKLARALQGTATKALQLVDPESLHPRDMLAMLSQGVQIERLAMEMATSRVELGKLDLSTLTDEQLERIANGEDPQKVVK